MLGSGTGMFFRAAIAIALAACAASLSKAAAPQETAIYDDIGVARATGESLVRALVARGATRSTKPLYEFRWKEVHPTPTDGRPLDPRLEEAYRRLNAWGKEDVLSNETRLRRRIPPYGEAEVKVATCPADDTVSSIIVQYPRSANTIPRFAKVTRALTANIGRGPDETSRLADGTIMVDWKFADGTGVRAMFVTERHPEGLISSGTAPVTVSYLGTPVAQLCAVNFLPVPR